MKIHWQYLKYLVRHKWFVLVAGLKTGAPLWRLLVHDWSKFLPSEWLPYAQFFYWPQGRKDQESNEAFQKYSICELAPHGHFVGDRFNTAWLLHQNRNPHHWQFWLLTTDSGETAPRPMPDHFVREMVADWMGAGRAITGRWEVQEWYEKNRGKMSLHPETRAAVEALLRAHGGHTTYPQSKDSQ